MDGQWTGVIEEHPEQRGDKSRYKGKDVSGRTKVLWLGDEYDPLPLNTAITVWYKDSSYPGKDGRTATSSWIQSWQASTLPPEQQAHMNEIVKPDPTYTPIQETPGFGYIDIAGVVVRTMPTLKEQCVREWVAAFIMCGKTQPTIQSISDTIKIVEQAYETGQIQNYPNVSNPPAPSPQYENAGTSSYDDRNPPPGDSYR